MEANKFTEKEIKILMEDKCTRAEAELHLKRGATIYEDLEENIHKYMQEWECDKGEIEAFKSMIETKIPIIDWGVVVIKDKTYYIQYVL